MRRIVLVVLVALAVSACAGNVNQYLIEDFEDQRLDTSVSLLTIEVELLYDKFPNHSYGALRPTERAIFEDQLVALLSEQTRSNVQGKLHDYTLTEKPFTLREFELKNRTLKILAPERGTVLENEKINTRFVMILDQFHFTPYEIEVGGGTYAGQESEVENRMRFETKYLIWDNKIGEAVAWGDVDSSLKLNLNNFKMTYTELISNAFSKIINVSPFVSENRSST